MKQLVSIITLSMFLTLSARANDKICLENVGSFNTLLVEKVLNSEGQVEDVILLSIFENKKDCQEKALTPELPSSAATYNQSELNWMDQACYFELDTNTLDMTNKVYRLNQYNLNTDEVFSAPLKSVKLKQIHTGDFFFEAQQDCIANLEFRE